MPGGRVHFPASARGFAGMPACRGRARGEGMSVLGVSATLGDMDRGYVANERGRKGRRFAANEMQASTVRAFARQRVQFGTRRAATASISGILARHAIDEALASTRSSRTITPSGLRSCRTWMPQRTPTDHANTIYQSPYALLGTRAHYAVGPGGLDAGQLAVFVEAGNLTGTTYASSQLVRDQVPNPPPAPLTSADVPSFMPGQGRTLQIRGTVGG